MTRMENPSKIFGEVVAAIDHSRDVAERNVAIGFPILNRKILDRNVASAVGRNASVDHLDGRFVVAVHWSGVVD